MLSLVSFNFKMKDNFYIGSAGDNKCKMDDQIFNQKSQNSFKIENEHFKN